MCWRATMFVVMFVASLVTHITAYDYGAPPEVCGSMYPDHEGALALTSTAPFTIRVSKTSYSPGDSITVTISQTGLDQLKGSFIQARRTPTDGQTAVGEFTNTRGMHTVCGDNGKSAITHSNDDKRKSVSVTWKAPPYSEGDIEFKATIVVDDEEFWVGVPSPVVTADVPREIPTGVTLDPSTSVPADGACGVTKGCFSDCLGNTCRYLITWQNVGDFVKIEMASIVEQRIGEQYISIGLSTDIRMGADSVMSCIVSAGNVVVQLSYNNGRENFPIDNPTLGMTDSSGSLQNNVLRCAFTRARTVAGDAKIFSLADSYYLMFVKGPLSRGSIIKHTSAMIVSSQKIDFQAATATAETTPAPIPTSTIDPNIVIPADNACGGTKGCFSDCTTGGCHYLVTWTNVGTDINIEIAAVVAGTGNQYISIGLSYDDKMGDDSVTACYLVGGSVTVGMSYNTYYGQDNAPLVNPTLGISQVSGSIQNGVLRCQFMRPQTESGDVNMFTMAASWYLLFAKGPLDSTGQILKHTSTPIISSTKLDFQAATAVAQSTPPATTTTTVDPSIVLPADSACGVTKGCMSDCQSGSCHYLVTWTNVGTNINIEIAAAVGGSSDQYIAIGLSSNVKMGDDSVMACYLVGGSVTVGLSYNTFYIQDNTPLENPMLGISQSSGSIQNGVLRCQFTRPQNVSGDVKVFSMAASWYLQFVKGPLDSTGRILKHTSTPIVSSTKLDFRVATATAETTSAPPDTTTAAMGGALPVDNACDVTKGCFSNCVGTGCSYQVTWQDTGNGVTIEIAADVGSSTGDQYIAIGLSTDPKMGSDSVMACMVTGGIVKVQMSYNNGQQNQPVTDTTLGISQSTGSVQDGVLRCQFTRAKNVSDPQIFSLDTDWIILFAKGPVSGDRLEKHTSGPVFSPQRVDFQSTSVVTGNEVDDTLMKVHGCLMIVAWIFCSSVGIVMARYFKALWPDRTLCSQKIWFQIHRTCMVTCFLCTAAGFVIIFVDVQGYSVIDVTEDTLYLQAHPILGIIVMGLTLTNPIMALFRCHPGTAKRPIFNWAHFIVGTGAHFLAVITISLGLNLEEAALPKSATYVLIAYAAVFVLVEIILELPGKFMSGTSSPKSVKYEMSDVNGQRSSVAEAYDNAPPPGSKTPRGATAMKVLLGLHVIIMLAASVTLVIITATS